MFYVVLPAQIVAMRRRRQTDRVKKLARKIKKMKGDKLSKD